MLTIKLKFGDDVRRLSVLEPETLSWEALLANVVQIFSVDSDVVIKYLDEEGDHITVACDDDVVQAIKIAHERQEDVLRIIVKGRRRSQSSLLEDPIPANDQRQETECGNTSGAQAPPSVWEPSLFELLANEAYYGGLILQNSVSSAFRRAKESEIVGVLRERVRRTSESARDHLSAVSNALEEALTDIVGDVNADEDRSCAPEDRGEDLLLGIDQTSTETSATTTTAQCTKATAALRDPSAPLRQQVTNNATAVGMTDAAVGDDDDYVVVTQPEFSGPYAGQLRTLVDMGFERSVGEALLIVHKGDVRAVLEELTA